jgi:ketosteroid isomerase-like protein
MDAVATVVSNAMQSGDLPTITALLAPDVRWGDPEQSVPTCTNKSQVLRWYENAHRAGASADVIETVVLGRNILLGLAVRGNPRATSPTDPDVRWQVMSIEDGKIAEIRGYESRGDAERFATSGTSHW